MSKNTLLSELINYISANSSGNVVIAAPTSGYALDVTGTGRFTSTLQIGGAGKTSGWSQLNLADYNTGGSVNGIQIQLGNSATNFGIGFNGSNFTLGLTSNGTSFSSQFLNVTQAGNVGIGTTSPSEALDVVGTINVSAGIRSSGEIMVRRSGNELRFGSGVAADYSVFYAGGSERMRLTSGGQLLVGKTSSGSPDRLIDAAGGMYSSGISAGYFWENRSSSSTFAGWYTTSATIYLYQSSIGNIASINYTSGAYTALSDINKKKDFELSTIGLYEVMQLKPTLYRMKSDDTNGAKELGFIAQEVKDYIPQAYVESDGFIGLNDRPMLAAAIKAIQELKLEIDLLKQQ